MENESTESREYVEGEVLFMKKSNKSVNETPCSEVKHEDTKEETLLEKVKGHTEIVQDGVICFFIRVPMISTEWQEGIGCTLMSTGKVLNNFISIAP